MRYMLGVLVTALLLPLAALGQSVGATTGAINGKVVDSSDSVLPGVTVTISAPQMQGAQTAVTNAEGNYRFPGIPPGTYMVPLRAARIRQRRARGHSRDARLHGDAQRHDGGLRTAGNGDGDRRLAGGRRVVDQDVDQLRLPKSWRRFRARATCGPSWRSRPA